MVTEIKVTLSQTLYKLYKCHT